MIVICALTDCAGGMSLVYEKPEADLLTRPPRDQKADRFANPRLILHAYGFIGMIECFSSMAMAFWVIQREGVPFSVLWLSFGSYPPEYDIDAVNKAINVGSSVYFVNVVIMQFFNLLCTRTRRLSILQQPPIIRESTRNYWLFLAMAFAFSMSIIHIRLSNCSLHLFVYSMVPASHRHRDYSIRILSPSGRLWFWIVVH
jgi:sodium/potassium-transporting ATPase subunit alpha